MTTFIYIKIIYIYIAVIDLYITGSPKNKGTRNKVEDPAGSMQPWHNHANGSDDLTQSRTRLEQ